MNPEQLARQTIDRLLQQAGWQVSDAGNANIHAYRGLALREFPLPGHGFADYLLYVDGKAAGVIEAKKAGITLSGVEIQAEKYISGLPPELPAHRRPLPFSYQSSGGETRFTNGLDPQPRSRPVFAFHRPETLAELLDVPRVEPNETLDDAAEAPAGYLIPPPTFLARLRNMPSLIEGGLWPAQIKAINNLEQSLRENRPRALIQMGERRAKEPRTPAQGGAGWTSSRAGMLSEEAGSGKTFTAISFIFRLIKFAGSRRVLFLVGRGNSGDQTQKDKSAGLPIWSCAARPKGGGAGTHLRQFQQYISPYNNFKFSDEYAVQGSTNVASAGRARAAIVQRL